MRKFKNKKAFTIIELIIVIAILGVLVLLATPKFLGYTTNAKVSNVKNDVAAYENAIEKERIDNEKYIEDWERTDVSTMDALKNSLFTKKGLITDSNNVVFEGEYYKIPKDILIVKTNLKGDFYLGQGGEVYYYDEKLANRVLDKSLTSPPVSVKSFSVTFKDYYGETIETKIVEKGQSVVAPVNPITGLKVDKWDKKLTNITSDLTVKPVVDGPIDKDLGYSNSDFIWVKSSFGYVGKNKEKGYFKYAGTERSIVEIPHVIQGVPMTSYYSMFKDSINTETLKIISTNKNVTNMQNMFSNSQATGLDLSDFDTSNVTNMQNMFASSQATNLNLSNFNTSKVTNMIFMFSGSQATSLDLSSFNTSNVTNMSFMFSGSQAININLNSFNTSNVMDMQSMFSTSKATSLDLSSFNTSNVTIMSNMFFHSEAKTIDLSSFDTSKVASMYGMFRNSEAKTLDLSSFNTSNVTNMSFMFNSSQATNLNLKSFNTSNVTKMECMFYESSATSINLSSFNTSNVTNMHAMFYKLKATVLDLSSFDTSNVTSTNFMFFSSLITTGYARTQADADKFNTSTDKPTALTFVIKEK